MRKLLLATVAALGASMGAASYADAQVVDDSNIGMAFGDSTEGQSFPTPGTVTVRLNGRYKFYAGVYNAGGAMKSAFATPASAASTSASGFTSSTQNTTNAGINKLASYGFLDYIRLYPGFDGVAANGLKYGASLEFREDNNYTSGGGAFGSVSGASNRLGLIYARREFGYIGTDTIGTFRFGAGDQPTSLYLTGTGNSFDGGGLSGDIASFLPGNVQFDYPFTDQGNLYTTIKAVYLSPQFYGFDGGVSYEPNTTSIGQDGAAGCGGTPGPGQFFNGGQSVASAGCAYLSSTSTGDVARRRNLFEALLRYRGTFGPVGVAATVSFDTSGKTADSGIPGSTTNPKHYKLEDLNFFQTGAALTYAGFTLGGTYQVGRYNIPNGSSGPGALIAKGQPNGSAIAVSLNYVIGPVAVGAQAIKSFSMGDGQTATGYNQANNTPVAFSSTVVPGGQRVETGFAAGSTYSVAPGLALFLSYYWAERKQSGYNFITGASNSPFNNKTDASVVAVGTSFSW